MTDRQPEETKAPLGRRRALALLGGGAAAVSILGLAGCGGDDKAPTPELIKPEPDGEPTPPPTRSDAMAEAESSAESTASADSTSGPAQESASDTIASDGGSMPRVDENSAKAKQLAYVHDASTVSSDAQPRYEEGQQCANCALYQGGSAAWGACPLFTGQQVKRTGWCNAYAPRGA